MLAINAKAAKVWRNFQLRTHHRPEPLKISIKNYCLNTCNKRTEHEEIFKQVNLNKAEKD